MLLQSATVSDSRLGQYSASADTPSSLIPRQQDRLMAINNGHPCANANKLTSVMLSHQDILITVNRGQLRATANTLISLNSQVLISKSSNPGQLRATADRPSSVIFVQEEIQMRAVLC